MIQLIEAINQLGKDVSTLNSSLQLEEVDLFNELKVMGKVWDDVMANFSSLMHHTQTLTGKELNKIRTEFNNTNDNLFQVSFNQ